jgi:hypothetical protein
MINNITFWIFFGFWPIWIIWELALLIMRGHSPSVGLISMIARDRAYQFSFIPLAWGSLAAHFWANWHVLPPWDGWWCGVIFFGLLVACAGWDWYLIDTPYDQMGFFMRLLRWPGNMLLLGLLNGIFVFPQRGYHLQPF